MSESSEQQQKRPLTLEDISQRLTQAHKSLIESQRNLDAEWSDKCKRWDAFLGISREPEKEAELESSVSFEILPIATFTGTPLPVEALDGTNSSIISSSEEVQHFCAFEKKSSFFPELLHARQFPLFNIKKRFWLDKKSKTHFFKT